MAEVSHVLARLKKEPFGDLPIAAALDQLSREANHIWRKRLLPPLVVLRLFVIQILSGNCAITALRHLSGIDFAPSSYSEARKRMPLQLLQSLLQWMSDHIRQHLNIAPRIGHRILIADGSTYSMQDTAELHEHFELPRGTRPGVGYPSGKLMGLLDWGSGMFLSLLALPLFCHDMRGVIGLHPTLRQGDILLGDRAFCSFVHLCLLQARGVFAVMRLHQRRKAKSSGLERWKKPTALPAWMDRGQFALLPVFLEVRIVRHTILRKGYRSQVVMIATTLLDQHLWPDQRIAQLYAHRWEIETCFDHLKTTMNMNVLRCKSVEGVSKELAVYLAVYNLVRLAMLKAAKRQGTSPSRVSFVDALRFVLAQMMGLPGIDRLIINPLREGRSQLRVIRGRYKQYDLLRKPRREVEAEMIVKNTESR